MSKRSCQFPQNAELMERTTAKLVERVKTKSPSMKARGVSFAIEAIATLKLPEEQKAAVFARLEKVVLTKMDEFIPHYLVKILVAYA